MARIRALEYLEPARERALLVEEAVGLVLVAEERVRRQVEDSERPSIARRPTVDPVETMGLQG
jgi:hypothetical protein